MNLKPKTKTSFHQNRVCLSMAMNLTSAYPNPSFLTHQKHNNNLIINPSLIKTCAQSQRTADTTATQEGSLSSSSRTQLDLLGQLTSTSSSINNGYHSDGNSQKLKVRDQLARLAGERDGDFSLPLGKNLKKVSAKLLTISQRRNIRRQDYLNQVSQRNDSVTFATIGAFVLLPPLIILGIAILNGYVQLMP